uniref:Uncharacterized protein n=1 Tax=Magnetococcus massalia (strain MO-1) TaxID=451514 RepID=A0A1S7LDX6_MAGMO|nr:Protein of unknown function [Candidatus Magnetococcus massalia]
MRQNMLLNESSFYSLQMMRSVAKHFQAYSPLRNAIHIQLDPTSDNTPLQTDLDVVESVVKDLMHCVLEIDGPFPLVTLGCRDMGQEVMLWIEASLPHGGSRPTRLAQEPFMDAAGREEERIRVLRRVIEEDLQGSLSLMGEGAHHYCFWLTMAKRRVKCVA